MTWSSDPYSANPGSRALMQSSLAGGQYNSILLVIPTLVSGGAERVFVNLARALDHGGACVTLAVFDLSDAAFLDEVPAGVAVVNLKSPRVRYGLLKLIELIWKIRPGVVLSTLNHLNVAVGITKPFWPRGVRFALRPAVPVSLDMAKLSLSFVGRSAYRWALAQADLAIFQTSEMESDFRDVIQPYAIASAIIPNPVDIDRIRHLARADDKMPVFDADIFRIVAAGRLDPQKGFAKLIESISWLRRNYRVSLTILGEGQLRCQLEQQVQQLGLADTVSLPGNLTNPFAVFARSDLFVLSSEYEGFPNVVLEALACGVPVIAPPLKGLENVLAEMPECAVLPDSDVQSISNAVEAAIKRGRRRVPSNCIDSYDAPAVAQIYRSHLENMLKRNR